ncbi:MAG: ABC transporter ATP-binding protein [Myxococcales bacterium]|nr:ABC transporter ATP-binding protein [Myxococcales bacterium]
MTPLPALPAAVERPGPATRVVAALSARGLKRRYQIDGRPVDALAGVDIEVQPGESVAIVGKSGAGKSTLLNLIGALDRGYEGELRVFGRELRTLSDAELARFRNQQIGFVFQAFHLLPQLSVGRNVMLPAAFGGGLTDGEVETRARALLAELGLSDRFDQNPAQMSGGERQRVAIARALLLEPPLLVCDEPTGSLDAETGRQILAVLADVRARRGTTLLLVTHDPAVARSADRTITLAGGRSAAGEAA